MLSINILRAYGSCRSRTLWAMPSINIFRSNGCWPSLSVWAMTSINIFRANGGWWSLTVWAMSYINIFRANGGWWLGCPKISLDSETKRNESENERSEIARKKRLVSLVSLWSETEFFGWETKWCEAKNTENSVPKIPKISKQFLQNGLKKTARQWFRAAYMKQRVND